MSYLEFTTPRTFTPFVPAVRTPSTLQQQPSTGSVPNSTLYQTGSGYHTTLQSRNFQTLPPTGRPQQVSRHGAALAQPLGAFDAHSQGGLEEEYLQHSTDLTLMQNQQKSTRICRHNQRGRCTWGDHCRFVHDIPSVEQPPPRSHNHNHNSHNNQIDTNSWHHPAPSVATNEHLSSLAPLVNDRSLLVGIQQAQLQTMRHAKLLAALKGTYETSPSGTPGHVTVTANGQEPDTVAFLSESQMAAELRKFDDDQRFVEGGSLLYLIGEPSVFYSAVRMFNTQGTCGHNRLDFSLHMTHTYDLVECMFHRSTAGCQALKCGYEHRNLYAAALEGSLGLQLPAGFRLMKKSPMPTPGKTGVPPVSTMVLPAANLTPPPSSLYSTQPAGKFTASSASFSSNCAGGGLSATSAPGASGGHHMAGSVTSLTGSADDFIFLGDSPVLGSKKTSELRPSSAIDLSQWDTLDKMVHTLKTNTTSTPSEGESGTWGSGTGGLGFSGHADESKNSIW